MFALDFPRETSSSCAYLRSAFTLIELMISIALVLLLILGVNQVFTYTTQAVGAGEAINAAIRSSRAAQSTFAGDFSQIVPNGTGPNDSGCIIISSRAYYAYTNAKDKAAEGTISGSAPTSGFPKDNSAFVDINGDGLFGDTNVQGEVVYPSTYNFRNHRLDVLSFFARGQFARQTGNAATFVDNMSTTDAWIWYGHLLLPDNSSAANFYVPSFQTATNGVGTANQNNIFGSQFVLGRLQTLLREKSIDSPLGQIFDNALAAQRFINRLNPYPTAAAPASELQPLTGNSPAAIATDGDTSSWLLQDGRFDLAATTVSSFRNKLLSYLGNTSVVALNPAWYDQMMDGSTNPLIALPANTVDRFKCIPFVSKPMNAAAMAQASPYFLGGCSQFIVEFAGDFVTQDNNIADTTRVPGTHPKYGDIIGNPATPSAYNPDGQLDFFVDSAGAKHIIWYGMPRGTSGNIKIFGPNGNQALPPNGDVVPLRDWLQYVYNSTGTLVSVPGTDVPATFEKYRPPVSETGDYSNGSLTMADANNGYTCAFGPNDPAPKLIRITMTLTDPTGRLPDGVTYQYVFPVPTPGN